MSDDRPRLEAELAKIEKVIAAQENLRGILSDEELEAALTALREKQAAVQRQQLIAGDVINGDQGGGADKIDKMQDRISEFRTPYATSSPQTGIDFLETMRAGFIKPLLEALKKIELHACTSSAAVYVNRILHKIREMEERSPNDPILEVLFAFYDALACDGLWATYTSDQYAKVRELLSRLTQRSSLRSNDIEKAIRALEDIGFDTTPYSLSMDDEMYSEEV